MKVKRNIRDILNILKGRTKEVEEILDSGFHDKMAPRWMAKTQKTLTDLFGKNNQYALNFQSIDLHTPFVEENLSQIEENDSRLALEDARVFLVSLMDELESEYKNAPGIMDMESIFAEINRYVSDHVDSSMKKDFYQRISILKEGLFSGDMSSKEVRKHIKWIGDLDSGLFERLVPLITWFYIDRDNFSEAYNN
jgi:hypothetical protein